MPSMVSVQLSGSLQYPLPMAEFSNYSASYVKPSIGSGHHHANQSSASSSSSLSHTTAITLNSEACPIPFVVHIILELLLEHKRLMCFSEVEIILKSRGFQNLHIASNEELFEALNMNERIFLDLKRRQLFYVNPYENVSSAETLLQRINQEGYLTGLRVTDDLLSVNPSVRSWLNELFANKKVRCIRPNNSNIRGKQKCRFSSFSSPCDIYSRKKCPECFDNLKDLLIYPLGDSEFEDARYKIDPDVKALWDSIDLPPLETILKDYNIEIPYMSFPSEPLKKRERSKNKWISKANTKMRRIQNTHLFTAEELRDEIEQNQSGTAWPSSVNGNGPA